MEYNNKGRLEPEGVISSFNVGYGKIANSHSSTELTPLQLMSPAIPKFNPNVESVMVEREISNNWQVVRTLLKIVLILPHTGYFLTEWLSFWP